MGRWAKARWQTLPARIIALINKTEEKVRHLSTQNIATYKTLLKLLSVATTLFSNSTAGAIQKKMKHFETILIRLEWVVLKYDSNLHQI